jgi:hypothetical protein
MQASASRSTATISFLEADEPPAAVLLDLIRLHKEGITPCAGSTGSISISAGSSVRVSKALDGS